MLARLSIRDIVIIERLDLELQPGLTVLTGETGAGKSILLDALALALGSRGDGSLVRAGCDKGQISAVFVPPPGHPSEQLLADNDVPIEDTLILRRVQGSDGRSRAFINDQPVSGALLRAIGTSLVEIHGQHADRALVDPVGHRLLLDAFGGLVPAARRVRLLWDERRSKAEAMAAQTARLEAVRREADYLRASVEELERLQPDVGEEERLAAQRARMMAAQKVAADLADAADSLSGSASPVAGLASVMRRLERKADAADMLLRPAIDALARSLDALEDARLELESALRETAFDPHALEGVEERLFALRAASRKYQVAADELPGLAARMSDQLADLDAGEDRLRSIEAELAAADAALAAESAALSQDRQRVAATLEAAVADELPPLKLERARFIVALAQDDTPGPHGLDRVSFHAQTNPGTPAGPLLKVASGGELSRFLLALKVSLADRGSAPTLIFDEIDTGVGGAVSEAIGVRMARLADTVQVVAITHAPQVAAQADHHLLIAKEPTASNGVATRVQTIEGAERREEVARMLAGAVVTDEARAAAARLIAPARS